MQCSVSTATRHQPIGLMQRCPTMVSSVTTTIWTNIIRMITPKTTTLPTTLAPVTKTTTLPIPTNKNDISCWCPDFDHATEYSSHIHIQPPLLVPPPPHLPVFPQPVLHDASKNLETTRTSLLSIPTTATSEDTAVPSQSLNSCIEYEWRPRYCCYEEWWWFYYHHEFIITNAHEFHRQRFECVTYCTNQSTKETFSNS